MEGLGWIGEKRRRLGITQQQLARMAGVSQSLVAKIEAGSVDAAYSKVTAIVGALERVSLGKEKAARDIMHPGTECAKPSDTLHSVALLMRKKSISQLPVVECGAAVGSISEQAMLASLVSGKKGAAGLAVSDIMEEAFPNVLPSTPISAVASLLRHHSAVLVMERGRMACIITKADLLKTI